MHKYTDRLARRHAAVGQEGGQDVRLAVDIGGGLDAAVRQNRRMVRTALSMVIKGLIDGDKILKVARRLHHR
ncbi:hypothetical protein UAJ10_06180 [Nitrospirillum sp. BR 11164]|uniref:hypothetical protein n=1 Tax=Nitrospirillum sp. BR 11164 TaxID=3104324 RepID=UPI002AFFD6A0|nr:hypothetical protein [Nitrospirillum sp. BR 11164]MEA1648600.1 hypothetical protein [Nitrospirillum sp. BR 11164]